MATVDDKPRQGMTWIDLRRTAPSSEDLEQRRTLLGLVNKLTFSNMDTISGQMVNCMQDPYLLGEAVEMVFNQAINPAWMTLFAQLCCRLSRESPVFGRHKEINFRSLFLDKYRREFEQTVYIQVPSLTQICAKCVSASMSGIRSPLHDGPLTWEELQILLPQELVSYLQERPWIVTAKAGEQRWRRMNELIVMLGELYNVHLVEEAQVHGMLAQLCDSIEKGMHRNVEPLCKLLITVGLKMKGQDMRRRQYLHVDQDASIQLDQEEATSPFQGVHGNHAMSQQSRCGTATILELYINKAKAYRERIWEWKLGQRIRFMIDDLLALDARGWQA